jgi:UDP-N-acetylglucosamine:LPS N-acetylglucosamine transferase
MLFPSLSPISQRIDSSTPAARVRGCFRRFRSRLFPKRLLKGDLPERSTKPLILAISSPGGHWVQLRRMRAAWENCTVIYVSALDGYAEEVASDALEGGRRAAYYVITDANRWQRLRLLKQFSDIAIIVLRYRPDVIVSTGAAAGYFALRIGKLVGSRTIWVDSIANAESVSMAGQLVAPHADLWLTQWEDLARHEGPQFFGAVI